MTKTILLLLGFLLINATAAAQWQTQTSNATVRFRGVSAVSDQIAWASGANGTYARTVDGGKTWQTSVVPGAEKLDFRDVEAFDANTAYLLSIGPGEASRIYKTTDGGKAWTLQFTNTNPKAFFDAIAFWDMNNGLAVSDPVDGRFVIIRTSDGGKTWTPISPQNMPASLDNEGAFAASGTCLIAQGKTNAWFATGGAKTARVFRSSDNGQTWFVASTPIKTGNASSGIFSIAFKDARFGIIVGGDYQKEKEASEQIAVSVDGGRNWTLLKKSGLTAFRSAVTWIGVSELMTVGPSGSDVSPDDGASWKPSDAAGFHAFSFARKGNTGWAVGEKGSIARFKR